MIAAAAAGNPYSEVALVLAFAAFLMLLIEIVWVRCPADLDRDLRLPLDEAPHANGGPKGGDDDGAR
jgi:hypothetical protein